MSRRVYVIGESVGCGSSCVLGRIKFWRRGGISRLPDGCILCVRSEWDLREVAAWVGCGMRIAGLIALYPGCSASLAALPLPCFIASCELCEGTLDGRIALIDPRASRLLIDPDLETLSEYAKVERASITGAGAKKGVLRSASELSLREGGDIFEGMLELIEYNCTGSLCISLEVARGSVEKLREEAEAIFRAAVYGDISVMLTGFRAPQEVSEANSLLHSVFCELEAEGREVNGCVARGILIDAPIWLGERQRLGGRDFICFDFDLITSRLLGSKTGCALDSAQTDSLCRFWEDYRSAVCSYERAELRAVSHSAALRELFYEWVDFMNIREIYLTE